MRTGPDASLLADVIRAHQHVKDVCVVLVGDGDHPWLGALLVPAPGFSLLSVREYLVDHFTSFTLPLRLIPVKDIPATQTDRTGMQMMSSIATVHLGQRPYDAVLIQEMRQYVADRWKEVLEVDQLSANSDFFGLGGDSILAFQVHRRIERELCVGIELRELILNSRLSDIADLLAHRV